MINPKAPSRPDLQVAVPRGRSRLMRAFASARALLATLVLATASLAALPQAHAGVITPFTSRYNVTTRGDGLLIGNNVLTCPANCAQANGSGANNDFTMVNVDVDADATTFNSSSADLVFPAGATVLHAVLYWGADTSAGTGGTAATDGLRNQVQFRVPGGSYTTLVADRVDDSVSGTGHRFSARKDVTALVANAGAGTYFAANVRAGTGADRYGGWSLVVIFHAANQPLRSLTLFDGYAIVDSSTGTVPTSVSGFRTPATGIVGARIGLVAYEGDNPAGYTGDQFQVNGTAISDTLNPADNIFNSTNSRLGTQQSGRNPNRSNQFGFDIDYIAVAEGVILNNATSANLAFTTGGETFFASALLFVTNVYEPEIVTNFTKSVVDVSGTGFHPGDVLEYTIDVTNTGDDTSDTTVVTDTLPAGVTYVPGSLRITAGSNAGPKTDAAGDDQANYNAATRTITYRLGTGANGTVGGALPPVAIGGTTQTMKFRATIDAAVANGAGVSNTAGITFVGATSGTPGTGTTLPSTFTATNSADVSITKSGPANVQTGGAISYTIVVSSAGPDAADGARVTDNVPAGITGVTITCAAAGGAVCPSTSGLTTLNAVAIPTLPSGSNVTFTITGIAPATATSLSNSASVAMPAGVNDPTPGNNSAAAVVTTVASPADLAVTNVVSAGPHYPGQNVTYTITVTNNGPAAAASDTFTYPLPAGLTFVSMSTPAGWSTTTPAVGANGTITSTRATLASGASSTFTVVANVPAGTADGTTFVGTATIASTTLDPDNANNSASASFGVTAGADVSISKTLVTTGTYHEGQPLAYTLVVSNAGPVAATNVQVTDTPTNMTITAVSGGGCAALPCTIPSIASGASVTINVTAVALPGTFDNAASVSASEPDPTPGNNADTTGNGGTAMAAMDLAVTNVLTSASPTATGSQVTYTITVSNNGPSPVSGATLVETMPPQLTDVTWTCASGCDFGSGAGDVNTGINVPVGGSITILVTGTAPATTPSTIAAATVTVDPSPLAVDTNLANNSATAPAVPVTALPINAADDTGGTGGATGGIAIANVLGNDTFNGATATTAKVMLAVLAPASTPNVALDTTTGAVNVAAGTPAGTYTITYRICETANPGNCDDATATVSVTAAALVATNDAGSANGQPGGTAVPNVLANDTIGGAPATTSLVMLTQVSTTNPGVTLDASTGAVNVAPNTPAGTYTVTYRICEPLNPTNCTTANVTVTVTAATLVANDDAGSANGQTGGTAVANVLGNDSVNGTAATLATVTLTQVSTTNPGVTLAPSTGAVNVAPGTPAGTYTVAYRICEQLNPTNCTTANVSVTVTAAVIDAVDDSAGPIEGSAGATGIVNVLTNDTLGGGAATTANVSVTPTTNGPLTLNANGTVDLAPNTPAGTYTLTYQVCEQLNPSNCDSATVTVTVAAAVIDAVDDSAGPIEGSAGATGVVNVLGNDTLNGAAATTSNVTVTPTGNGPLTLDANGMVDVAANTAAGTYTLTYRICQQLNPSNCDTATVTVTVSAAAIAANDDTPPAIVGATGGTALANVLANDTLGSATPTLSTVTLAQVSTSNPAVTLDASTGAVNVAAGTPAGTYTLVYRICQQLNPANCDTATVTVVVFAAAIDAVNDTTPAINGVAGSANAVNVLGNDMLNGAAASLSTVTLGQVSTTNPGITLDASTGNVAVAAGTPAGTYTLTYRLCEQLNPTNCDTATVTVNVVAPALAAVDDSGTTTQNHAITVAVLGNDTMAAAPVAATAVTVTIVTAPSNGTAVVNANGTITYTPATNYSGADNLVYRICDVVNPTVCSTATVALTVTPNAVDAIDQSVDTPQTGPVVIDPMDTTHNGGGAPLDPGSVQIVTGPSNGMVVVHADGTITYTPNPLFFGTDGFTYRICDRSTPTPVCDTATVTITVAMQAPQLRLTKTVPARAVHVGDLVRYTVVVENTGISPANGATVVDVPPAGFTYVEGSLSVDDADDAFVLAGADPIRIDGIDVPVGARATITYVLRVGAGVGHGTHTNRVSATDAGGTTVSNTATADVTVEGDPTLDDALILGTVFADSNGDGVQQAGEPGLPGVRIASVEGLVIETDVHGRYHVAGITPSNAMRGSNFVLKVDAATLPPGTTFTTSNPLVRRITPGIPVRFDFGVKLPEGSDATGSDATR